MEKMPAHVGSSSLDASCGPCPMFLEDLAVTLASNSGNLNTHFARLVLNLDGDQTPGPGPSACQNETSRQAFRRTGRPRHSRRFGWCRVRTQVSFSDEKRAPTPCPRPANPLEDSDGPPLRRQRLGSRQKHFLYLRSRPCSRRRRSSESSRPRTNCSKIHSGEAEFESTAWRGFSTHDRGNARCRRNAGLVEHAATPAGCPASREWRRVRVLAQFSFSAAWHPWIEPRLSSPSAPIRLGLDVYGTVATTPSQRLPDDSRRRASRDTPTSDTRGRDSRPGCRPCPTRAAHA